MKGQSLKTVHESCGFSDYSSFYRAFKKEDLNAHKGHKDSPFYDYIDTRHSECKVLLSLLIITNPFFNIQTSEFKYFIVNKIFN